MRVSVRVRASGWGGFSSRARMRVCSLSPSSSLPIARACSLSLRAGVNNVRARQRTVAAEGRAAGELRARQLAGRRPGGVRVVGVRDREAVVARELGACACARACQCARACKRGWVG